MLDTVLQRSAAPGASLSNHAGQSARALHAGWREGLTVLNLRGDPVDAGFGLAVRQALGIDIPQANTCVRGDAASLVWAGPDDWFVIGPAGQADALAQRLRDALAGRHAAVTDVSSGYTVLHLSGLPVREVLAQGCPLDLHPRVFHRGQCAGSHFFKASVWLWQADDEPVYELLVRRSFMPYVWLMLERTTLEGGLVRRRFP